MDINVESLQYSVKIVGETGIVYDVTPALISLWWEEQTNELSQRVSITTANMAMGDTWLMAVAKIGCMLSVSASWGEGFQEMFVGKIWEWGYQSSQQKEISISAYDHLKLIQQSYDYGYYASGQSTDTILSSLCREWGIPLAYQYSKTIQH